MSPKSPIVFFLCRRLSIGSIGRGGLQLRFQPFHFAVRCFGALQQANRELDDFFEADHTLSSTVSITALSVRLLSRREPGPQPVPLLGFAQQKEVDHPICKSEGAARPFPLLVEELQNKRTLRLSHSNLPTVPWR